VAEAEKREARLKEVFKAQVSNFREACFCLFGYRVDMASQARLDCCYCT
jgi:mitotic spindle assembly checkpoint protein MAD1